MLSFQGQTVLTTLEEILAPSHTLLLLYDFVNAAFGRVKHSSKQSQRWEATSAVDDMLPRCKRLADAARAAGIPVMYTRHLMNHAWASGPMVRYYMRGSGVDDPAQLWAAGPPDTDIVAELTPHPEDVILDKYYNSAFSGTNFSQLLHARSIKTLVLTGLQTESGIETTARQALIEGYYTVIPVDCVNSGNPDLHEGTLRYLRRRSVTEQTSAEEIINIWRAS